VLGLSLYRVGGTFVGFIAGSGNPLGQIVACTAVVT
jgi:hypothetical protein